MTTKQKLINVKERLDLNLNYDNPELVNDIETAIDLLTDDKFLYNQFENQLKTLYFDKPYRVSGRPYVGTEGVMNFLKDKKRLTDLVGRAIDML